MMGRWWLSKQYGLPPWMVDGLPHWSALDDEIHTPVAFEGNGGPGGGASGGTGGGSGAQNGGGNGAGSQGDGGGSGSGSGGSEETLESLQAKITQLNQELRTAKQSGAKVSQLEKQIADLQDKDKTDLEKANERVSTLERSLSAAVEGQKQTLIRMSVERTARTLGIIDEEAAFALMDRSGLEVSDDGTVTGVKEALEALLVAKPYLKNDGEGNKGGNPNAGSGKAPGPTPQKQGEGTPPRDPVLSHFNRAYGSKPRPALLGRANGNN